MKMKKLKFIIILMYLLFVNAMHSQTPTLTISNVTVNGQPITNNTINFGNLDKITVRYRVDFIKPKYLHLGNVSYVSGVYNNNGFVQLFTPETLYLPSVTNEGFQDLREYELYATNYSTCNTTHRLVASVSINGSNVEYHSNAINIKRNPIINLSTNVNSANCNSPVVFNANTNDCIVGSIVYKWTIGNGWILPNGTNSPAILTSSTNTISLIPIINQPLPVSVTPILNGIALPPKTLTIQLANFSSTAQINGNTVICSSNSSNYTINNLGAGNTVTWSSSNTAVATVSGGTQSQVTVNGVANGFADIIATISNACGQTVIKKNTVYVGVPTTPAAGIYANPMWVRNNFFPLTIDFPVIPNATSYVWTIENDPENPPYCTTATSYPAKFVLNNSNTTLATTTPSAKINFGGCFGTYFIKCKAINNCGETDVFYKHIWVGSSGSSPCNKNNNISSEFKILQNPIKNGVLKLKTDILFNNDIITEDASILQGDGPCEGPWEAPIIGKVNSQDLNTVIAIYDMAGVKRLEKQIDNNKESIEITNFNLPSGNYILHFKKGNQISKKIIIIE